VTILSVTVSNSSESITGTTVASATVEVFSDSAEQGQNYEGSVIADSQGVFSFSAQPHFAGPNVTATSTDVQGNTSAFCQAAHLQWTLLLYLNGDNDLEQSVFDTVDSIARAGPSPLANVLTLVDGPATSIARSETVLYDLTAGEAIPLSNTVVLESGAPSMAGERNMGDGQTLVDFAEWGRARFPSRYVLLAIFDHGGGWAPSATNPETGEVLPHRNSCLAGNSGLSWDHSSDYDYLESAEIRNAMAQIANDGKRKLDVVFYDVCTMAMIEVAYQIKDSASYFVSSENIGWAPSGPQNRYVRLIQGIEPATEPVHLARLLVAAYEKSLPPEGHPFTISAVNLFELPGLAVATDDLAAAIMQSIGDLTGTATLGEVYKAAQKLDYDSDLRIEPNSDGFVDLYDFAYQAASLFEAEPNVVEAAQGVMSMWNDVLIAEAHRSGSPWFNRAETWNIAHVHGLSIFLPLGEDLVLPVVVSETKTISVPLRSMYTSEGLDFVGRTCWGALINAYYAITTVPTGTTTGPVLPPVSPDVTAPETLITVTGRCEVGETITITWSSQDSQTGVASATLWQRMPGEEWTQQTTQSGSNGAFPVALTQPFLRSYAVLATDLVGNSEAVTLDRNTVDVSVPGYVYLPLITKSAGP
jgi:hypothetical protein